VECDSFNLFVSTIPRSFVFLTLRRIDKADEYEVCLCLKSQRKDGFVLYIYLVVMNWLD
jgi:hypothetical protein